METTTARRVFSRIGMALALMMAIQQLAVAAIGRLVGAFLPQLVQRGWYVWALLYGPLYLVAFPVFLLFLRSVPDSDTPIGMLSSGFGDNPPRITVGAMAKLLVASLGIIYPLQLLATVVSAYLAEARGRGIDNSLQQVAGASGLVYNLVCIVVVAPVMEELLFRRILYNKLIRYGGRVYVLFSALVFSLFHVSPYQLVYAFLLGLVFAYLTQLTGTIRHSVTLHMLINFVGSGAGPLLLAYGGGAAVAVWGVVLLLSVLAGIVMVVVWLATRRNRIVLAPGLEGPPAAREILLNGGMLLYTGLVLVMVAAALL